MVGFWLSGTWAYTPGVVSFYIGGLHGPTDCESMARSHVCLLSSVSRERMLIHR